MKIITILLMLAAAIAVEAQIKKPQPPPVKKPFAESLQAVVVTTKDWPAVQGTARRFERKNLKSAWKPVGESFPVVVGRNGLAWSTDSAPEGDFVAKKEGDGKAPAGMFPLTFAFGSADADKVKLPYTQLGEFTECVDDVNSLHYNKIVDRMKVGAFDWKSSEKMLAVGAEYELGVFVAHNSYPVRPSGGSCIFLHIWKNADSGTAGCTAMERTDLEKILAWADPNRNPYLVQLPQDVYKQYIKSWNLPKIK